MKAALLALVIVTATFGQIANPCADTVFVRLSRMELNVLTSNEMMYRMQREKDCAEYQKNLAYDRAAQMHRKRIGAVIGALLLCLGFGVFATIAFAVH